jgi:hypothetical protein
MRRILLVLSVAALMAAMMVASAMPAFAAPKDPNFGQCAAFVATTSPPGPLHGAIMSEASFFNPHGEDLECPPGGPVL